VICRGFPLLFFSIWKLCCFVIWLGVGTNMCYWLRLFCTLVDHSEAISLVWTTRGFYPWFEGFSTLKILVPLFVLLVIYYCCSLIIAPHRFLQVRGNYICCILWYIVCCCFPHQSGIRALGWAIFTCLNDRGKCKDGCFEWYKLPFVEGQDERFIICQEIASSGLYYTEARFYV